jgi:hypothetical protein
MAKASNLLNRFPNEIDHRELLRVIQDHFGRAAFDEKGILHFPASDSAQLRVKVTNGLIDDIEPGEDFAEDRFQELLMVVQRRLADSPGEFVARVILHSSRVIQGYWRDDELGLQLTPPTSEAPRPPVIMADHPFVLEVRLHEGGDGFITNERILRAAIEWGLVLNAVLRIPIVVPDPRIRHLWVYDDEAKRSRWLQASYFTDSFEQPRSEFSKPAELIPVYPHDEYYESKVTPGAARDIATLPDSLSQILSAFAGLSHEERSIYLRAARWVQVATAVWDLNASSWVTAMVSALETLVPKPSERCRECGNVLGVGWCATCGSTVGVSREFRDFVERYSRRSDYKMRQTIYSLRSRISHGSMLLAIDDTPWAFGATFEPEHRQTMEDLLRIVRDVMVNWLLDHSTERSSRVEA